MTGGEMEGQERGDWALATAAGKDATLALARARDAGLSVRWAVNVFEGNTGRVRFHGTPRALVRAQARALELEPVLGETHPDDFETVFCALLAELRARGCRGVLFGNLHLDEIRAWYEERVTGAGLEHREPLWGTPGAEVVREVVRRGFRARVVSVNLALGDPAWLGRELDEALLEEFLERGIDPAGEHGEFHTLVRDGPGFRRPLEFEVTGREEREGHLVELFASGALPADE